MLTFIFGNVLLCDDLSIIHTDRQEQENLFISRLQSHKICQVQGGGLINPGQS